MAVVWMDNWQQYGTSIARLSDGPYASVQGVAALVADPDVLATGNVLRLNTSDSRLSTQSWGSNVRKVLPSSQSTIGIAFRWWVTQLPDGSSQAYGFSCADSNNTAQVSFVLTPTGTIKVKRGTPQGGTVIAESSIAILTNAWQHIEAKIVIGSGTSGSVEIRVDTVPVLVATGLNTQAGLSTVASVILCNGDADGTHATLGNYNAYYKDFYVWDNTGTYNNSFLGSCFVYSMRPDSDVSGTWSIFGGAGSGFASINESSPDDDTKYIYSPSPAATADVFTMTDLPSDATTVKAMMTYIRAKKSDGGDGNIQVSLVSGASTGNGTDRPMTVAYTYWNDIFETDPATTAPWTVAAANAAKLKVNRTL
jgi:hypothetical protein